MIPVGAHVDSSDPIVAAAQIGATAAQIFLGDPQSWKKPATTYPDGPDALREAAAAAGVTLFVHAPYIINVASPNNRIRIPSRKLLAATVTAAARIGAAGVIVHGGHVTAGHDDAEGFANWRKAFESFEPECPVLIENTAGGNHAMARYPESLARLWDSLAGFDVGFCFDTCHAWAGGMALPEDVAEVRAITGRVDLVHANDSLGERDSGRDRHANFGAGTIGVERLLDTIAAAEPAAVVCETPAPGVIDDIELVRERLSAQ
ncbi:MAG: deoxyribonuclease IV [Actinobacteria bacterium]|nr:deoxyribonuclease IV [Actinomycetota bacterium]MCB9411566.1 deoxyribonuclease IV [Actinomycetota bacterium]